MEHTNKLIIRITLALFIAILGVELFYPIISPLTFYLSYLSLFFLKPIMLSNTSFSIGQNILEFIPSCAAASAYLLLTLLILTTKDIDLKKGIKIFLLGSALILLVNIIRIDFLAVLFVKYSSNLFETLHNFIWRIVSTIFVVMLWITLTYIFNIKTIPIYSDFKEILKHTNNSKGNK